MGSSWIAKAGRGVVMKRLWPCRLLQAVFVNFILVEIVCMAALWTPVRAGERSALLDLTSGWLGVSVQDLTPDLAKSLGLKRPMGALIAHVVRGGPADKAGIKKGDVVTSYQGKEILDGANLQNEIATSLIGQEVQVTLFRNGKKQTLTVRVGNLQKMIKEQASSVKGRLGVDVRPVTSKEIEGYGLNSQTGVVVIWVHPDSPLAGIGFEVNDMILEINFQPIDGLEVFVDLVSALRPEQRIILLGLDHRTGQTGYVQVMVP